jgi:hypothetical protein
MCEFSECVWREVCWEEIRTERQLRFIGKPLFELGLPKRLVPIWRTRPGNMGVESTE